MATPTQTFELTPPGPFSLELAATFGFGHRREQDFDGVMRLAFALDGLREHAGVVLRQDHAGAVHGQVDGVDPDSVEQAKRQIARILSLDHDGEAWLGVGERDPVIGALQRRHLGLRPVLFHSPYEAAAWGLISARQGMRQASAVRERIAARLGRSFELEGRELHAFPLPPALATLDSEQGLNSVKAERLRVLADRAAQLDIDRLRGMSADDALADVQTLDGIGPFYASLVVVRACGHADTPAYEPLLARAAAHYYGLSGPPTRTEFETLAENWRPFRTWACVLLRYAGTREGLFSPR